MHRPIAPWYDSLLQLLITLGVLSGIVLLCLSPGLVRSGCVSRWAPGSPSKLVAHDPATCPQCRMWRQPHDPPAPGEDPYRPPSPAKDNRPAL